MELRIFTEPQQGASYQDLLAVAKTAESSGFGAFFRSDHYLKMGDGNGLPGPSHAWISLAGLARDTETIRLGTLVSPITFYHPGPLAIMVAQVDAMSGGRVDFGFGCGWYEAEHAAYGLGFPALGERFDRFEEALAQSHGLWTTPEGSTFSHHGRFHTFSNSPALPKPAQKPCPPILIGGRGKSRTPKLAAQYASDFNVPFSSPDQAATAYARLDAACEAIGRNPDEITKSATAVLCLGANETEFKRRASDIGREPDELRANGAAGTVQEVVDSLAAYAKVGTKRMYLQVLSLGDLDHVSMAGHEIIPTVADL